MRCVSACAIPLALRLRFIIRRCRGAVVQIFALLYDGNNAVTCKTYRAPFACVSLPLPHARGVVKLCFARCPCQSCDAWWSHAASRPFSLCLLRTNWPCSSARLFVRVVCRLLPSLLQCPRNAHVLCNRSSVTWILSCFCCSPFAVYSANDGAGNTDSTTRSYSYATVSSKTCSGFIFRPPPLRGCTFAHPAACLAMPPSCIVRDPALFCDSKMVLS